MTDVRRESRSGRRWTKPALASAAVLLLAALGIATNVATGAIPASWTWMKDGRICWSLVGILTVLCTILTWWQTRVDAESSSVEWPLQVGMIPRRADPFQERHVLKKLDRLVFAKSAGLVTCVLSGLGGSGKTQLAAACARRALANHGVELLLWTTATSRDAIQVAYAEAAIKVGLSPLINVGQASGQFLGWLQTTTRRWMVVLDDLQDPADLQGLWPDGSTGRVLVTTQRRDAALARSGRKLILVEEYTSNEAYEYLQQAITDGHARKLDGAFDLAIDLGCFPLALAQAAAFIQDRHETCAGYRDLLRDSTLSKALPANALADDYQSTVTATLRISVERADGLPPEGFARATLQFASGLDPNGAPIDVFTTDAARRYIGAQYNLATAERRNTWASTQDCLYSLTNLDRFNLTIFDSSMGMVCTHALVQRATLEELSPEVRLITVAAVNDALMELWANVEGDVNAERMLRNSLESLRKRYGRPL